MRPLVFSLLAIAISPLVAAADPLETVRAASNAGPVYAFDMVFEQGDIMAKGSVDPTQPEGQRLTVTEPARETWSEDFETTITELDKEAKGDIWCGDFAGNIPEAVELTSETDDTLTYTFQPAPDADADGTEKKLFRKMIGTAVIAKTDPAILSFQIHLPEPMKPNLMAKISTFSMFADCARAPDGRTYVADMQMNLAGSALGQDFSERVRQQVTRLFEPANPAVIGGE